MIISKSYLNVAAKVEKELAPEDEGGGGGEAPQQSSRGGSRGVGAAKRRKVVEMEYVYEAEMEGEWIRWREDGGEEREGRPVCGCLGGDRRNCPGR